MLQYTRQNQGITGFRSRCAGGERPPQTSPSNRVSGGRLGTPNRSFVIHIRDRVNSRVTRLITFHTTTCCSTFSSLRSDSSKINFTCSSGFTVFWMKFTSVSRVTRVYLNFFWIFIYFIYLFIFTPISPRSPLDLRESPTPFLPRSGGEGVHMLYQSHQSFVPGASGNGSALSTTDLLPRSTTYVQPKAFSRNKY